MRAGGREPSLAENAPLRRTVGSARARAGLERQLGDEASALWDPRFGLEPLIELGLPLSPPRSALLGGRPPVGRVGARSPQAAPTLATLLGRGDFDSIARLIESGLLDPASLPPSVRADILARTRPGDVRTAPTSAADVIAQQVEAGTVDPASLPPSVRADVLARARARAPAAAPTAEAAGGGVTGDVLTATGLGRLAKNVASAFLPVPRATPQAGVPTGPAPAGADLRIRYEPLGTTPEAEALAAILDAERQQAGAGPMPAPAEPTVARSREAALAAVLDAERQQTGAGPTPSAPSLTFGMTEERVAQPIPEPTVEEERERQRLDKMLRPEPIRAPFLDVRPPLPLDMGSPTITGTDQRALLREMVDRGVITPEQMAEQIAGLEALQRSSMRPSAEALAAILDAERAGAAPSPAVPPMTPEAEAAFAARAGGSAPVPTARPAFRISYEPLPTLPAEAPTAGQAQVGAAPTSGGPGIGALSHGVNAALGLASGAARLAQGETAGGALETARGVSEAAAALGAEIPYVGPALALASIGEGAASGAERAAVRGAISLAASLIPGFGIVFGAGQLAETLINLGLSEYTQGDLSKAIMDARQKFLYQYGNQAVAEALRTAPDLAAAMRALAAGPPGTQGQVQFGVGNEFAGVNDAPGAVTPRWQAIVRGMSAPTTLAEHPDLVASFIQNLWVQTGPSGAAIFNPGATRDYQTYLLSKLPYTPDWLAARQKILNMAAVDPRDTAARDRALAAVPDLPVEPGFLRVNGLRIPVDHRYRWFDGSSGVWHDYSPERVGQTVTPWGAGTVYDETAGRWLGQGGAPHAATDAAYLDPEAMATPWFREKAGALRDEWQARIPQPLDPQQRTMGATEPYNPIDMRAFADLERFLAPPVSVPPEPPPPAPIPAEAPTPATTIPTEAPPTPEPVATRVSPPPQEPIPATIPPAPIPAAVPAPAAISATEMPPAAPPPTPPSGWVVAPHPATGEPIWMNPMTAEIRPIAPTASPEPPPAPSPTPEPVPSLRTGGVVPRTGVYRLHAGETVVPTRRDASGSFAADLDAAITEDNRHIMGRNSARGPGEMLEMLKRLPPFGIRLASHEQSETLQLPDGSWANVYGRSTPRAGQRLPRVFPFERDAYPTREEAEAAARQRSGLTPPESVSPEPEGGHGRELPDGSWYLDPARGLPFRSGTNPEPEAVWRLAFDAEQLHGAWKRRGTDGWPLLVPPSVLDRGDWPAVVERARRTQYEGVHPAIALARAMPPTSGPEGVEDEDLAQDRFTEGLWEERAGLRNAPPVPRPEPTPPMRQMPGRRPMTPEEERGATGSDEEETA